MFAILFSLLFVFPPTILFVFLSFVSFLLSPLLPFFFLLSISPFVSLLLKLSLLIAHFFLFLLFILFFLFFNYAHIHLIQPSPVLIRKATMLWIRRIIAGIAVIAVSWFLVVISALFLWLFTKAFDIVTANIPHSPFRLDILIAVSVRALIHLPFAPPLYKFITHFTFVVPLSLFW